MSASLRSVDGQDEATILREIQSALRDLRFGAVEITVHNAQVVQIERKEKFRLQNRAPNPAEPRFFLCSSRGPTGQPEGVISFMTPFKTRAFVPGCGPEAP